MLTGKITSINNLPAVDNAREIAHVAAPACTPSPMTRSNVLKTCL
jgi:hypothetical protein